ncbi:hypothetical protein COV12_00370 [Candidatus Woesearchaeota archaeon CG10_big_fil_rev_8_21_14_0_10_32_24]|nr:MAG: hypothetical protein COV12_00370 [Candidatus Woesearchaeota archaeon CG10_big_fil_rev_8_21_14_0_10_32_24]
MTLDNLPVFHEGRTIKFMLFEGSEGEGYVRIQRDTDIGYHKEIVTRFNREAKYYYVDPAPKLKGGGHYSCFRNGRPKPLLSFDGESTDFGKFDKDLLLKTLETYFSQDGYDFDIFNPDGPHR